MGEHAGKTALVTGASRGIGAAIARRLASEGVYVAVNFARNSQAADSLVDEIETAGGRAFAVQADVSILAQIEHLFARCDEVFGSAASLDILINNAGGGSDGGDGSLQGSSEERFDRMMAVNSKAPFLVTQQGLNRLRNGGRIVNIGSVSGRIAQPLATPYGMAKRALQSLTLSTAIVAAERQITCNLIAPGAVDTELIAPLLNNSEWHETMIKSTPMGRIGSPADIAGAVMMLLGADADWVTGQTIEASGGLALRWH